MKNINIFKVRFLTPWCYKPRLPGYIFFYWGVVKVKSVSKMTPWLSNRYEKVPCSPNLEWPGLISWARLEVYWASAWDLALFQVTGLLKKRWDKKGRIYIHSTGQSIPIPHSGPFSHLRCGNGSQTYLNLYIYTQLATLSNYI